LFVSAKVPSGQDSQTRFVVGLPWLDTCWPGRQTDHARQAVVGSPSWSQVWSLPHGLGGIEPPAQYWPGLHGVHSGPVVAVRGAVSVVPAGQTSMALQVDWFSPVVKVLAGQAMHQRSLLGVGMLAT